MKLYQLNRGSKFMLLESEPRRPPADDVILGIDSIFTNRGIDGMYCKVDTSKNERIYLAAWTEVEEVK